MKIRCPRCRRILSVPERLAGKTVRCRACNLALTVPTPRSAVGGSIGPSDLDLEGLAQLEVHTTEMSSAELLEAEDSRRAETEAALQSPDNSVRTCPHCHSKVTSDDPNVDILCSNCWKTIPAVSPGAGIGGSSSSARRRSLAATGAGSFYGELAVSVAYPIPALASLLTAAGVAFCAALVPVAVMTILANLMEQENVGTAGGVQKADLSGVQMIFIGIFAAEVFFFSAVAVHSFFDVVRTTFIRDDKAPNISFSPHHWGKSFFSYLILCVYFVVMTYLVAELTIKQDVMSFLVRGDLGGLLQSGGRAFIVGMVIVSFFVPMNLLGISMGSITEALNPVPVARSVANTHVHYVFLVLILLVYGGMFAYAFAAILFEWFLPQVDTMFSGSATGNILNVAMPMLAWGAVMAFFFYGTYILARLHGLFARSFRRQLLFGPR